MYVIGKKIWMSILFILYVFSDYLLKFKGHVLSVAKLVYLQDDCRHVCVLFMYFICLEDDFDRFVRIMMKWMMKK